MVEGGGGDGLQLSLVRRSGLDYRMLGRCSALEGLFWAGHLNMIEVLRTMLWLIDLLLHFSLLWSFGGYTGWTKGWDLACLDTGDVDGRTKEC